MSSPDRLRQAQRRVKNKKGFVIHFAVYVATMVFLFIVNSLTSPDFWWFLFPLFGWAIGVVAHYITVYGFFGIGTASWAEKELAKEMEILDRVEELKLSGNELELKDRIELETDWDEDELV